jgi:cytochrome c oxidase subunit 2
MKVGFKLAAVIGLLALTAIACSTFFRAPRIIQGDAGIPIDTNLEGVENGERIYFTAIDSDGYLIRYRGGPDFGGMMMGAYLTCASCHGPDGRGGTHYMHMQVMDAPDIRYEALVEEAEEHGGQEHSDEHGEYSLEDFHQAVVEGEHPDGEPLSREMPRWQISDQDLQDLFAFLKTLP